MVDPELFERYRRALGTNADLAKRAVEELLSKLDGLTQLEQAEYLLANYPKLVRAYGKVAADVARQYYQESRDAHFAGDEEASEYVAQTAQPIPERWLQEDVSDAFTGNHGMTVAKLPGKASKRTMQRADETITQNARRDRAHPRWAFVPSFGACPWCIMIGTNGFVFRSERTAAAERHLHCSCAVVADFDIDNPHLDGYDPSGMYERMMRCAEQAGTPYDWDAARVEAETRDREWLRTGRPAVQDYSRSPRNAYGVFRFEPNRNRRPNPSDYEESNFRTKKKSGEWRDLFAHDVLSWNGIGFETRPVRFPGMDGKAVQGATSPDLAFDRERWGAGYLWEVKSPLLDPSNPPKTGNELSFIGGAFKEAATRNFRNPYDPMTNAPVSDWDGMRRVVLNLRYRQVPLTSETFSTIKDEMKSWHIYEVYLIDSEGSLTHIK